MTRYYFQRDYDTPESELIAKILREENPYKLSKHWLGQKPRYVHEARDLAQWIDSNRIYMHWASLDAALGSTFHEWAGQSWYDGDYRVLAERIIRELEELRKEEP